MKPQQDSSQNLYLVHHAGQVQGPFDLDFVEAMVMSGVYAPSVMIQKAGTTSQVEFSQVIRSKSGLTPLSHGAARAVQKEASSAVLAPATRIPETRDQSIPQTGITNSKPLSIEAKFAWVICISVGLFLFWIFGEVASKRSSPSKQTAAAPYADNSWSQNQPPQTVPPQTKPVISQPVYTPPAPIYTPPAPLTYTPPPSPLTSGFPTTSYPRSPSVATPGTASEESTQIYRDASGRMFRVPNSAYYGLLAKKTALESEKATLDQAETEISALSADINRSRRYLDRTSQYSVDSFNQKVNRVNEMSNRLQDATDAYNRGVDAFNAELARVGTPIY
ncbi:MAG: hypothetical protein IAE77_20120 [Prosthecobacter sp.]|uniref:hypothetical protein n=1 Tax=Prosthecobacter sp. TaxID=1965333 RepID=UPI0019F6C73F|nr:hypothetical protein [Prosthecobacter sp.]MBE2285778.1 hypothetical protein [Prosthecobacter sp.]